jgi:hypothetical protein
MVLSPYEALERIVEMAEQALSDQYEYSRVSRDKVISERSVVKISVWFV